MKKSNFTAYVSNGVIMHTKGHNFSRFKRLVQLEIDSTGNEKLTAKIYPGILPNPSESYCLSELKNFQ
jgi:hypothetical protein